MGRVHAASHFSISRKLRQPHYVLDSKSTVSCCCELSGVASVCTQSFWIVAGHVHEKNPVLQPLTHDLNKNAPPAAWGRRHQTLQHQVSQNCTRFKIWCCGALLYFPHNMVYYPHLLLKTSQSLRTNSLFLVIPHTSHCNVNIQRKRNILESRDACKSSCLFLGNPLFTPLSMDIC